LHPVPWWWPLPVLAVAGVLAAIAIVRLPGHGGHIPYEGIKAGTAQPAELPGILLAALATLGLGLVLGPEAPLIALGVRSRQELAAALMRPGRGPAGENPD
jgi:H+/Cl- antiporter ClcA